MLMLKADRNGVVSYAPNMGDWQKTTWIVGKFTNQDGQSRWFTHQNGTSPNVSKPGYASRDAAMWDLINRNIIND